MSMFVVMPMFAFVVAFAFKILRSVTLLLFLVYHLLFDMLIVSLLSLVLFDLLAPAFGGGIVLRSKI